MITISQVFEGSLDSDLKQAIDPNSPALAKMRVAGDGGWWVAAVEGKYTNIVFVGDSVDPDWQRRTVVCSYGTEPLAELWQGATRTSLSAATML